MGIPRVQTIVQFGLGGLLTVVALLSLVAIFVATAMSVAMWREVPAPKLTVQEYDGPDVTLTTRPMFEAEGYFGSPAQNLVIADATRRFKVFWILPDKTPIYDVPLTLDQNYTFTFSQKITIYDVFRSTNATLRCIVRNGRTLYDREICGVHQVKMKYQELPVVYGLISGPAGGPSLETARKSFPHSPSWVWGGCGRTDTSPKTQLVLVCDQCLAASVKWAAENPPPPPAGYPPPPL